MEEIGRKHLTSKKEEKKPFRRQLEEELQDITHTPKRRRRQVKKNKKETKTDDEEGDIFQIKSYPKRKDPKSYVGTPLSTRDATHTRRKRRVKKKITETVKTDKDEEGDITGTESAQKGKDSKKYVGAHLSIQGGIWEAVLEARRIGASAIGMFLGSQRTWTRKALEEKAAEKFRNTCKELEFKSCFILPHSPYLMNLGSPKPDVLLKSRSMLVEELQKCHQLGLTLYNIHPGSRVGAMSVSKCLKLIADGINFAHSQVPGVTVVLENMSCQGSTVGGRFEELRGIIDQVTDKSRIGVCLDTCHAFAAGYDLSKKAGLQSMLDEFSKVVGISFLKAVHLNDSKGEVGCKLDRHENIGYGHIGLEGFRNVMNEPRFNGIPMILETPLRSEDYSGEINLLNSLCTEGGAEGHSVGKH